MLKFQSDKKNWIDWKWSSRWKFDDGIHKGLSRTMNTNRLTMSRITFDLLSILLDCFFPFFQVKFSSNYHLFDLDEDDNSASECTSQKNGRTPKTKLCVLKCVFVYRLKCKRCLSTCCAFTFPKLWQKCIHSWDFGAMKRNEFQLKCLCVAKKKPNERIGCTRFCLLNINKSYTFWSVTLCPMPFLYLSFSLSGVSHSPG